MRTVLIQLTWLTLSRIESAVAMAPARGAFPACHDHVCVISCGALCGGVPGGARSDLQGSPQIYPEDDWHCFEVYGPNTNYLIEWRYCFNVQSGDIHTRVSQTHICEKGLTAHRRQSPRTSYRHDLAVPLLPLPTACVRPRARRCCSR